METTLALNLPGGPAEGWLDRRVAVAHLRPQAVERPRLGAPITASTPGEALSYLNSRVAGWQRARALAARGTFDAAVIGLQGLSPHYVCRVIKARRRFHFIRNDLSRCDPQGRIARAIRKTAPFVDGYICVSDAARDALLAVDGALEPKAHTVHNLLDPDAMRTKAGDDNPYPDNGGRLKVLTVIRLSERPKALLRMVRVHQRLRDQGLDFDWFVVGDGPDRPLMAEAIDAAQHQGRMHLLGRKDNPFPYYRHADLVALLSHYEGLSGTINEAKVLNRAVIATDVGGAREQLGGGAGLLVPDDEDAIVAGLGGLLQNPQHRAALAGVPLPAYLLDDDAKLERLMGLLLPQPALEGAQARAALAKRHRLGAATARWRPSL